MRNLLAASTSRHVLLLDLRRPAAPLLQWAHTLTAAPPTLLTLAFQHATVAAGSPPSDTNQENGDSDSDASMDSSNRLRAEGKAGSEPTTLRLRGVIIANCLASGDAVIFRFTVTGGAGELTLVAAHAAPEYGKARRRAAAAAGFPGSIRAQVGSGVCKPSTEGGAVAPLTYLPPARPSAHLPHNQATAWRYGTKTDRSI